MDRPLRVLYWNPGGISKKQAALRVLAQEQDIHIILLGETKLKPASRLTFSNFETYRRDEVSPQNQAYRGTAVLVRRDIVHEELPHRPFVDVRTTGVRVRVAGQEINIFAGYRPPATAFNLEDIRRLFDERTPTLLAADLNAKHREWGSRLINPAGRRLQADAEAHDYTVVGPDSPTHIPSNPRHYADVLDVVVHKHLPCPIDLEVLYDLDEQHLPLLVTLAVGADMRAPRPARTRVDWPAFAAKCEGLEVGPISTPADVEENAAAVTAFIKEAITASTTPAPPTWRRDPLPRQLQAKRAKKRALRKLWATSRCPRLKRELNALADEVAEAIQAWRGVTWDARITEAADDPTRANLHQLNRALTREKATICPLRDSAGRRHYTAADRAELLAGHLEQQFQLHEVPPDATDAVHQHHQMVREEVAAFLSTPAPPLAGDSYIQPREVVLAARQLPNRKAPGDDRISNAAIKRLPARGLVALCRLYNGVLRTQHFPSTWKLGRVIMLPKSGKDRRSPSSYRPITLLSAVAKLFERLLLRRLQPALRPRDEQHGFRTGHSTTLQLTRVLHHLAEEWNRGRRTVGVFLDIEKAFDRVWHEGLLFKLSLSALQPALVHLVASFLHARTFYVAVEDATSTTRPIAAGVPQGSCLSPALYGAYTDDIPTLEHQEWELGVVLALYADDSAYFASSINQKSAAGRVQRVLHKIPEWLDKWRMAVNVAKTQALVTGATRTLPPPLTLRGQDIKWENSVKYLGVYIDRALRMTAQVDHAVHQAKAARALLRPVLSSKLPLRTKVGVYKTYVRSRLTYAAPAWYALLSATQRKRLQVVQNVSLRHITGAGRYVRNDVIARDTGVPEVGEFVARLARRMFDRADNGPHPHLHNIAPLHARPPEAPQPRALPRDILPPREDEEAR